MFHTSPKTCIHPQKKFLATPLNPKPNHNPNPTPTLISIQGVGTKSWCVGRVRLPWRRGPMRPMRNFVGPVLSGVENSKHEQTILSRVKFPSYHYNVMIRRHRICQNILLRFSLLLDPETGLQELPTLLLFFLLFLALRLFHFTTDRRQTSHTHCRRYSLESHRVGFLS